MGSNLVKADQKKTSKWQSKRANKMAVSRDGVLHVHKDFTRQSRGKHNKTDPQSRWQSLINKQQV